MQAPPQDLLDRYTKKWTDISLSTEPTDLEASKLVDEFKQYMADMYRGLMAEQKKRGSWGA